MIPTVHRVAEVDDVLVPIGEPDGLVGAIEVLSRAEASDGVRDGRYVVRVGEKSFPA
jgi:hypothetical protein